MSTNQSKTGNIHPEIREKVDLRPYHTLHVSAIADRFVTIRTPEDITGLYSGNELTGSTLILGGGSNLLFVGDVRPLVLKNEISSLEIVHETDSEVVLKAGAGKNWHDLVSYCVDYNWGGIENLALIPGTVGAAPVQNIGAYGCELKDVFLSLEAFDMQKGEFKTFYRKDCQFGYRDSIFKKRYKGRFFITSVALKLQKAGYTVNSGYGSLAGRLDRQRITVPTIRDIFRTVVELRTEKLPDPAELANAGSFFKNPVIEMESFERIRQLYPNVPHYSVDSTHVKVPAGWLIEKTGWKGKREGDVGTYNRQALVIVNHGSSTGREVWSFSRKIAKAVLDKFDIELVPEVHVVGAVEE